MSLQPTLIPPPIATCQCSDPSTMLTMYILPIPEAVLLEAERKWELNLDASAFKSVAVIPIRNSLMLKAHYD